MKQDGKSMRKMLNRIVLIALFLLLTVAPGMAAEFLLFYSNDVHGETEPCGCKSRQLGGLSRAASQISRFAELEKLPWLFLDSGGLLFKQSSLPSGQEEQERITAAGIAEAIQSMNCRAVGLEAHDLAGGVELLKKIQEEQKLTWLSMNLVYAKKKQLVFNPWLLTETAGLQVAVLGLTGGQMVLDSAPDKTGYTVLPWKETLPKALEQVKGKAEMIILLSSYPYEVNKEIAEAYPAVHLLLASGPAAAATYPFMVGDTLFAQTGARGKTLGMMRISWTEAEKWEESDLSKIRLEQNRLDQITLQISRLEQQTEGKSLAKDDIGYQKLLTEKKETERKIKTLQDKKQPEGENFCRFSNQFIALESSLPEDPKVREIMMLTKQKVNNLNQERSTTENSAALLKTLVGWQKCGECHAEQSAFWQKTRHAQSVRTLEGKNQQFNQDCLVCHVTLPTRDLATVKTEKLLDHLPDQLKNVGCENCHGPAAGHAASPAQVPVSMPKPDEQTCTSCHTPEHDDHFVFAEKAAKIRCPKR
jgi:hypothetical protein